jgi:hypothetical protein
MSMSSGTPIRQLLERLRSECSELPRMRMRRVDVRQLWNLDRKLCDALVEALADARLFGCASDVPPPG